MIFELHRVKIKSHNLFTFDTGIFYVIETYKPSYTSISENFLIHYKD